MCLQTSKLFREHALASTSLLYDQIARIPGRWEIPLDCTSNGAFLIREFSRRAAKHLKAGSPWMSDVHVWRSSPRVDRKNSFIGKLWWDDNSRRDRGGKSHNLAFVEVRPHDTSVFVYFVEEGHGSDRGNWHPRLKHVISATSLSEHFQTKDGDLLEYEIVKVAPFVPHTTSASDPYTPRIAILYRARLSDCTCNNVWMKLLVFRLDNTFGPIVIETFNLQSNKNDHITAMAMSGYCEPVVLYQRQDLSVSCQSYKVVAYTIEHDHIARGIRPPTILHATLQLTLFFRASHRRATFNYCRAYACPLWEHCWSVCPRKRYLPISINLPNASMVNPCQWTTRQHRS
jgi:hypothetical protein